MNTEDVKEILELLLTQLDEIESLRLDHKRPVKFSAEFFDEMRTNDEHIYTLKWSYKEDRNIEEDYTELVGVVCSNQKAAKEQLVKWQQIAIDERAQIIQYHRGILHPLDRPSNFWESMPKDEYAECRDLAAKELGLHGYKTAHDPNGPIEINGDRYVKESDQKAYAERLERLALSICIEAGWDQEDFEAALEKIRRG